MDNKNGKKGKYFFLNIFYIIHQNNIYIYKNNNVITYGEDNKKGKKGK
jgi:hypothetical protein